jgi:spermidine synthase
LREIFADNVYCTLFNVPSFIGYYSTCIVSKVNPKDIENKIDELISERISGDLKFFDQITQRAMFSIPKDIRKKLSNESRVLKKDNFVFMNYLD